MARCPISLEGETSRAVGRHRAQLEKRMTVWPVRMFANSFLTTVDLFGRADDAGLMGAFMVGTMRPFTDLDLVPKVLPKGRLPILPHTVKARK